MGDSVLTFQAPSRAEASVLSLDQFLAGVERRAYRTALMTTRIPADALDAVQDAMMQLVQHYRERPPGEWPLLFQRILQNRLMDWHRQQARSKKWFWQPEAAVDEDEEEDVFSLTADEREQNPAELLLRARNVGVVLQVLEQLPIRQRQAFVLRAWEGFDVKETADAMGCSEGSVKTHYFRALQRLREQLLAGQ